MAIILLAYASTVIINITKKVNYVFDQKTAEIRSANALSTGNKPSTPGVFFFEYL